MGRRRPTNGVQEHVEQEVQYEDAVEAEEEEGKERRASTKARRLIKAGGASARGTIKSETEKKEQGHAKSSRHQGFELCFVPQTVELR